MSVAIRIIPCLDVKDGRVVKGVNFQGLKDAGDPVELASRYGAQGADEITFLDVSASPEGRSTMLDGGGAAFWQSGDRPVGGCASVPFRRLNGLRLRGHHARRADLHRH